MIKKLLGLIKLFGSNKKGWKDIKLHQAQELLLLEEKSGLDLLVSQMAIVLDTDEATIEDMPLTEITKFSQEYDFLKTPPEGRLIKTFRIEGRRFGMVPLNELTLAQIIDIEEYWNNGYVENLHKILSCLFLPIERRNPFNGKYKLREYKPDPEVEGLIKNMNMDIVWNNLLFFYHTEQLFLRGMKDYLEVEILKLKK